MDETKTLGLLRTALSSGSLRTSAVSTIGPTSYKWDISGKCLNPKLVQITGRLPRDLREVTTGGRGFRLSEIPAWSPRSQREYQWTPGERSRLDLDLEVRCRRCRPCLKQREIQWRNRALAEVALSVRTWMGTLTLTPHEQYLLVAKAHAVCARRQVDYSELDEEERWALRVREYNRHITLWLKRVRKESRTPIRSLVVFEKHKSGDPHAHVLIHQMRVDPPVLHRTLRSQWQHGFSHFKLTTPERTGYVCKYLSKSMLARVRASLRYGKRS